MLQVQEGNRSPAAGTADSFGEIGSTVLERLCLKVGWGTPKGYEYRKCVGCLGHLVLAHPRFSLKAHAVGRTARSRLSKIECA